MGQQPKKEDLEKVKDKFFSNVTHEFRTLLTLILGPVEQMLRNDLDPQMRQRLLLVQRNALQLQRLIDELLDISKIENEDVKVEVTYSDFARFFTISLNRSVRSPKKNHSITNGRVRPSRWMFSSITVNGKK